MYIDINILKQLSIYCLSLDAVFILHCQCGDTKFLKTYEPQLSAYIELIDAGMMDVNQKVTRKGLEFYHELFSIDSSIDDKFNEFWLTYPLNARTERYPNDVRIIRSGNKNKTKIAYKAQLNEPMGITSEFLLSALKKEIHYRREASIKENPLLYMQIPLTWLNNQSYLNDYGDIKLTNSTYGKHVY